MNLAQYKKAELMLLSCHEAAKAYAASDLQADLVTAPLTPRHPLLSDLRHALPRVQPLRSDISTGLTTHRCIARAARMNLV